MASRRNDTVRLQWVPSGYRNLTCERSDTKVHFRAVGDGTKVSAQPISEMTMMASEDENPPLSCAAAW